MKKPIRITRAWLKKQEVCEDYYNKFVRLFPKGYVTLTRANLVKYGPSFDLDWLAQHILTPAQWADYDAKCAPLDADYLAKRAPLDADYFAKHDALDADYFAKRAALLADILQLP